MLGFAGRRHGEQRKGKDRNVKVTERNMEGRRRPFCIARCVWVAEGGSRVSLYGSVSVVYSVIIFIATEGAREGGLSSSPSSSYLFHLCSFCSSFTCAYFSFLRKGRLSFFLSYLLPSFLLLLLNPTLKGTIEEEPSVGKPFSLFFSPPFLARS